MEQKYSLSWQNYTEHLSSMMKELMMNEDFSDVTLVTEDKKQIKANINILSACSPVFKDILKKENNSNQIMYLRGIQFPEIESIIQFIYLGEATFYEERMEEFLSVARSLEIKELSNAGLEQNEEPGVEPSSNDPVTSTENLKEENGISYQMKIQAPQERQRRAVGVNGKYECDQCDKTYSGRGELNRHKQSVHHGVKHSCDQCDYRATHQFSLKRHIESKHEGVKYACDHCNYQAVRQDYLTVHVQSRHQGVRYACDQCDYLASQQGTLKRHIESKHAGVKCT